MKPPINGAQLKLTNRLARVLKNGLRSTSHKQLEITINREPDRYAVPPSDSVQSASFKGNLEADSRLPLSRLRAVTTGLKQCQGPPRFWPQERTFVVPERAVTSRQPPA
jgi:hypothetical protein